MKQRFFALLLAAVLLSAAAAPVRAVPPDGDYDYDCHGYTYCPQYTLFYDDALPYDHWAHAAVDWAIIRELTNGVDLTHFGPELTCTRAQIAAFLWRANGCPEPGSASAPFADVPVGAYYAEAVRWAAEQRITTGTAAGRFDPDGECTRAQVVTFLWRASGSPAPEAAESPFADVPGGAYFAKAVSWAVEQGIARGVSETEFAPDKTCTRAEIVTFLYRAAVGN